MRAHLEECRDLDVAAVSGGPPTVPSGCRGGGDVRARLDERPGQALVADPRRQHQRRPPAVVRLQNAHHIVRNLSGAQAANAAADSADRRPLFTAFGSAAPRRSSSTAAAVCGGVRAQRRPKFQKQIGDRRARCQALGACLAGFAGVEQRRPAPAVPGLRQRGALRPPGLGQRGAPGEQPSDLGDIPVIGGGAQPAAGIGPRAAHPPAVSVSWGGLTRRRARWLRPPSSSRPPPGKEHQLGRGSTCALSERVSPQSTLVVVATAPGPQPATALATCLSRLGHQREARRSTAVATSSTIIVPYI